MAKFITIHESNFVETRINIEHIVYYKEITPVGSCNTIISTTERKLAVVETAVEIDNLINE